MSCQRGNVNRTRAQKHQNGRVFKNDLHDTNIRTKRINQVQIVDVCARCKAILGWKIKYKKYKLLTAPRSCNKCSEKRVKQPYHTVCSICAQYLRICPKCECPMSSKHDDSQRDALAEDKRDSPVRELSDLLIETKLEGGEYPSSVGTRDRELDDRVTQSVFCLFLRFFSPYVITSSDSKSGDEDSDTDDNQ